MGAERHEHKIDEQSRDLQRTTDELEEHIEDVDQRIEQAREAQASRREEANIVENAAGDWEHRARDDEGPFGVLGGPMKPPEDAAAEDTTDEVAAEEDEDS